MAGVAAAIGALRLDARDIVAVVEQGEVVVADRQRGQGRQAIEQARHVEEVAEAALGRGVLGMLAGLDREPGREDRRRMAGVVPEVEFVEVPTRRHRASPAVQCQPMIIWAARSAIMMVGALMLLETMRGITEASAMRRPSRPCTFMLDGSTTAIASVPMRQVLDGW